MPFTLVYSRNYAHCVGTRGEEKLPDIPLNGVPRDECENMCSILELEQLYQGYKFHIKHFYIYYKFHWLLVNTGFLLKFLVQLYPVSEFRIEIFFK